MALVGGGGIVDASPDYLADPIAAVHLSRFIPEAHIILLWRDPIKRAHAAWDQNRRAGSEDRSLMKLFPMNCPSSGDCVELAPAVSQFIEGRGNSSSGRSLVKYVERCAHFIDGQPKNCWVNKNYNIRPACKRVPLQGVIWGPRGHVRFTLFTCRCRPGRGPVRGDGARPWKRGARFLGVDGLNPPRKQTCAGTRPHGRARSGILEPRDTSSRRMPRAVAKTADGDKRGPRGGHTY